MVKRILATGAGLLMLFLFFTISINSKNLSRSEAEKFITGYLVMDESPDEFIGEDQLAKAERFGIHYDNVKYKFLIGYGPDEAERTKILNNDSKYHIDIENLDESRSVLNLKYSGAAEPFEFFFREGKLISRAEFYVENWAVKESKYFSFHLEDPELFNDYCAEKLDIFVEDIAKKLGVSSERMDILEEEKIDYYLCSYVPTVKELTGYEARGMYNLAFDQIISTFNCHYHELVHLLVNFKLQNLPLYTHPFFQEGLAVALGGRGGKEPDIILNMGKFLIKSGFGRIEDILSKKGFQDFDASFTYPMSGLFNSFMIKEMPADKYLALYRKYSGNAQDVINMGILAEDMGNQKAWENYVENKSFTTIRPYFEILDGKFSDPVIANNEIIVKENEEYYLFTVGDTVLISSYKLLANYKSKEFNFNFPNQKYNSEKYLILTDEEEISVYNLFTNNLIAKYARSISSERSPVTFENDKYYFVISKKVFDEDLSDCTIK